MTKVRLVIAFVLMLALVGCDSTNAGASVKRHRATTCTKDVADYQYASPQPDYEVMTATTYSCRTSAPWVLLIHGGSWINGTRVNAEHEADMFYSRGWQTFNMDYRRGPGITWNPLQENDLKAAWDFIVRNAVKFNIDPTRGTIYGFSAGGHMAAWLGTQRPAASVVSASGVLQPQRVADDDNGMRPDTEPTTDAMHNLHIRETDMMGLQTATSTECDWNSDMAPDCLAAWHDFMPETYLTPTSPPVYALIGGDDPVLPQPTPDAYCYHVRAVGVDCTSIHVPGYGHTNDYLKDGTPDSDARFHDMCVWIINEWK